MAMYKDKCFKATARVDSLIVMLIGKCPMIAI